MVSKRNRKTKRSKSYTVNILRGGSQLTGSQSNKERNAKWVKSQWDILKAESNAKKAILQADSNAKKLKENQDRKAIDKVIESEFNELYNLIHESKVNPNDKDQIYANINEKIEELETFKLNPEQIERLEKYKKYKKINEQYTSDIINSPRKKSYGVLNFSRKDNEDIDFFKNASMFVSIIPHKKYIHVFKELCNLIRRLDSVLEKKYGKENKMNKLLLRWHVVDIQQPIRPKQKDKIRMIKKEMTDFKNNLFVLRKCLYTLYKMYSDPKYPINTFMEERYISPSELYTLIITYSSKDGKNIDPESFNENIKLRMNSMESILSGGFVPEGIEEHDFKYCMNLLWCILKKNGISFPENFQLGSFETYRKPLFDLRFSIIDDNYTINNIKKIFSEITGLREKGIFQSMRNQTKKLGKKKSESSQNILISESLTV